MYAGCCQSEGLGYDGAGCTDWFARVTAAYFTGEFRPERGAECLAALAAASSEDPDRCANVALFDEATFRELCREAFGTLARTGSPLGGDCLLAADCASASDEGTVICYGGSCLLELRGEAGDGPCYLSGANAPTEAVQCHPEDGLYCHRGDNVCAPHVEEGEYCPYPNACEPTAVCTGGTCMPREPGLDVGSACSDPAQCASGVCQEGVCVSSDFAMNLNCTG
jgi:hypothetical protein